MGINHLLTGMILQVQVKVQKLHICYLCPGWFVIFHCLNSRFFLGRECDLGIPGIPTTVYTLPETKMEGWKNNFLLGWPMFRGELLVSGSVLRDNMNTLLFAIVFF